MDAMRHNRDLRPYNLNIAAYDGVKIEGQDTVSLFACDVPYLILQTGSDAIRIYDGSTVAVGAIHAKLINPFPFKVQAQVAHGHALRAPMRGAPLTDQLMRIQSVLPLSRAATVTGKKYGIGVMMKAGSAQVIYQDTSSDGFTKIVVFPGASANFLTFKPVGAMTDSIIFYDMQGVIDPAILAVGGLYTDADVAAWVTAAGYTGQVYYGHSSTVAGSNVFTAKEDCAVFVTRDIDKAMGGQIVVRHYGMAPEDFD